MRLKIWIYFLDFYRLCLLGYARALCFKGEGSNRLCKATGLVGSIDRHGRCCKEVTSLLDPLLYNLNG